jgi:hypothetical protein
VMPATWASTNTATGGTINADGLFTAKENVSGSNVSTTLNASFTLDGRTVTATKAIAVRDKTNYPASVTITGPNTVASTSNNAPGTADYVAEVTYLDGTKKSSPVGTWSVAGATASDPIGAITNAGKYTANQKPGGSSRNITVKFEYTEFGRTVTGTKSVALTVVPVPVSLVVNGAAEVIAGGSSTYTATVTMSDASTKTVTATYTTTAAANVATVTTGGVLTVASGLATTQNVTVRGSYTEGGLTVTGDKVVSAKKAVALTSISATGPNTLASGQSGSYVVRAQFDDGSESVVTAGSTYASSNSAAGTFSTTTRGKFDAAAVTSDASTVLTFSYTNGGITKTTTINMAVTAPVVVGSARPRWGVAMFSDTDFTGGKTGTDPNYDKPYTRWTGIQDFADKVMTNLLASSNSNEKFTANVGEAQYLYFMAPKALGKATFTDQAINIDGGMGGITWTPEGEQGDNFEGIDVQYDSKDGNGPVTWTIYRTDYDSLGSITFNVRYL